MTAAHCLDRFKEWKVVLGAQNINDTTEPGRVSITSTKAIKNGSYNKYIMAYDIGLINLTKDVEFSGKSHLAITKFIVFV